MISDLGHVYSSGDECERRIWSVHRLWELARDLPVENLPLQPLLEGLKDCYCFGDSPSAWDMASHARRAYQADLEHPIILSASGSLMDGSHRIAKAWMLGLETVKAVRFLQDPEPDTIVRNPPAGIERPDTPGQR